jgi:lysylphosphatidylglycerol synthetase-like protein (DUF2156 family)
MKKILVVLLFLIPLAGICQTDVLILQKNNRNIKTYAAGQYITLKTVYDQWLSGTLTLLRNDSVFINNIPFHVNEISAIHLDYSKWNYAADGTILIIAGVGVLALNVINGIYTKESSGSWLTTTGWITAGALILGGILLRRVRYSNLTLGKKYKLHYLNMKMDNPPANPATPLKTNQP